MAFSLIELEFRFLNLTDYVHNGTVTGFDDAHDPVAELYRVRSAYILYAVSRSSSMVQMGRSVSFTASMMS